MPTVRERERERVEMKINTFGQNLNSFYCGTETKKRKSSKVVLHAIREMVLELALAASMKKF